MSVVSFLLTIERRGGAGTERKGSVVEVANRKYSKQFRVVVDSYLDGPTTIMESVLCPVLGEPYAMGNDSDPLATCVNLEVDHSPHPLVWYVTASYDTERLVDGTFAHPLNQPAEIAWGGAEYTRPFVRDGRGTSVVMSSGDPPDAPVEYEDSRLVLTISRNEAGFSPALAYLYRNAVCSDVFGPALPGCAKMVGFTGVRQVDFGFTYYRVTYEIHFKAETYAYFILDQSYRDIDRKTFVDPLTGVALSNATTLNGRGRARHTAAGLLGNAIGVNDLTIEMTNADAAKFPPLATATSIFSVPPPHWMFEVRIDNEVLQITDVAAAGIITSLQVSRAYAGTAAAAHGAGSQIKLEPYYLRFLPGKVLPFAGLNLPVIA